MGGTVSVIIREEDGKVHKMARWTNSLPYFIKNMKFINKDKEYLNNYLKAFYDMKSDYEKNKESGNFQFNMTDVYIPDSGYISPIEYGIVVIDYQTSKIVHCQGYSSLDLLFMSEVDKIYRETEDDRICIQEIIDNKRIKSLRGFYDKEAGLHEFPVEYKTINGQMEVVLSGGLKKDDVLYPHGYTLDISPWEVIRFEDNNKIEFLKTKEKIKELGFEITEEDEKNWEEFINYRFKEEE